MNDSSVSLKIRDLRERLGWSQHRLARESNVSRATIARIENGTRNWSRSTLYSLASALQTSVEYLSGSEVPEAIEPAAVPKGHCPVTASEVKAFLKILADSTGMSSFNKNYAQLLADSFDTWGCAVDEAERFDLFLRFCSQSNLNPTTEEAQDYFLKAAAKLKGGQ